MLALPKIINMQDQKQFRIIPSTYPPINFFEDLVDSSEMEILWEIESLTNDRLRQETGDIFLVPAADRISVPGSSVVMAAFTHITRDKPTRFSDGTYGVYYAGLNLETAIRETVYRREQFLRATKEVACHLMMRCYEGNILKPLHDIRDKKYQDLHNPDSYILSQQFGKKMREINSWGLVFNSTRHEGSYCIAAFRPPAISIPQLISHLEYIWNGKKITEVLDTRTFLKF